MQISDHRRMAAANKRERPLRPPVQKTQPQDPFRKTVRKIATWGPKLQATKNDRVGKKMPKTGNPYARTPLRDLDHPDARRNASPKVRRTISAAKNTHQAPTLKTRTPSPRAAKSGILRQIHKKTARKRPPPQTARTPAPENH